MRTHALVTSEKKLLSVRTRGVPPLIGISPRTQVVFVPPIDFTFLNDKGNIWRLGANTLALQKDSLGSVPSTTWLPKYHKTCKAPCSWALALSFSSYWLRISGWDSLISWELFRASSPQKETILMKHGIYTCQLETLETPELLTYVAREWCPIVTANTNV